MDDSLFKVETTGLYVKVAVERSIDALTYEVPRGDEDVDVGERVRVPLGSTSTEGVVIARGREDLLAGLSAARVRPFAARLGVRLPGRLVELGQWMSDYYICPLGMTLGAMTPAAVKKRIGRRLIEMVDRADSAPEIDESALTPAVRAAWNCITGLEEGRLPAPPKDLARLVGARNVGPINRLVDLGLLCRVRRDVVAAPPPLWEQFRVEDRAFPPTPTPAQRRVIEGVAETLGTFTVHLLRGVTGSGKTEVYLRVIERVLEMDRTALMLVPEIALTPQTAGRIIDRFRAVGVAVLHSGLTASERHRQWAAAASGEARVVIGARSAIFAPLQDVGLIVVDEEHDTSYKQDQLPRYNARDVAVKRAQIEGVPVLLASATPSLESHANALAGRYRAWVLNERVGAGRMPHVELIDFKLERRALAEERAPADSQVGPRLRRAIQDTLDDAGQAILLLNRRGFAGHIACVDPGCGFVVSCHDCDVGMVLHRGRTLPLGEVVRCHHCHAEQRMPRECPVCKRSLILLGSGTQRLEEELERLFPSLVEGQTLLRLDSDTMRTARDYFRALSRFGSGEVRVLLGTQMVAKGLDYPNVRLVGVINADAALTIPDFRAAERTFQLVSQVAGRAGRGEHPGRVLVQTIEPDIAPIRLAAAHDYESFADLELACRREAGLPPVTRMARVVIRDEDLEAARARAERVADAIRDHADPGVRIEGPVSCVISRVARRYRFAIDLTARTPGLIQAPLRALRDEGLLQSDAHTAIDPDPIALL